MTTRRRCRWEQQVRRNAAAFDRHAPAGFKIFMQFSGNVSREGALNFVSRQAGTSELAIAPGYFDFGEDGDQPARFVPGGWMVFIREDRR